MPININKLSKGERRKLTALRKSLGNKIADKAFSEWRKERKPEKDEQPDPHMQALTATVKSLVSKGLKIPPSGLKITRGRGVISVSKIGMKKPVRKKAAPKKAPAKKVATKKG